MSSSNLRSNPGAHLPALGAPAAARAGRSDAHALESRAATWLARALWTLRLWHERARTRHELMRLDDRLLHDIGLTREEVEAEWRKPFWRA